VTPGSENIGGAIVNAKNEKNAIDGIRLNGKSVKIATPRNGNSTRSPGVRAVTLASFITMSITYI
tara:strand:- start:428 stop:622 length:195 start_codon:yes stop_codon:yes gene_type:complete